MRAPARKAAPCGLDSGGSGARHLERCHRAVAARGGLNHARAAPARRLTHREVPPRGRLHRHARHAGAQQQHPLRTTARRPLQRDDGGLHAKP